MVGGLPFTRPEEPASSHSVPPVIDEDLIERIARFARELRRRKVVRAAGGYLFASFVALQVVDASFDLIFAEPETAGRVVLGVLIAGFPVAVVLAWMFDVRPPRFEREATETSLETVDPDEAPGSVAVLPLTNLSDEPENLYFSEGITDDIVTSIAHIEGLRVLSRGSVVGFRDRDIDLKAIAAELGVAAVVLGSVRREGTRVRIFAELVDGTSGSQIWSDTFDRELRDIFEVQSEVARQIADAVRHELTPEDRERIESRGTTDPEAYDLYLRGRHLWAQRTEGSSAEAIRYLKRALQKDPGFALAHAGVAEALTVLGIYGAKAPDDVFPKANKYVEAALAIDPSLGEALAARACLLAIYDWKWAKAEDEFGHALDEAPSYATAHQWYGMNVLTPQGRFEEARAEIARAKSVDPASAAVQASSGIISFYDRDYPRSIQELEAVTDVHPDFPLTHYFLGQALEQLGRLEDARTALERARDLAGESSETMAALGHVLGSIGRQAEAEALLHRLVERGRRRYVSSVLLAQVLIGLGRLDEALDRLEDAAEARATDLIWLRTRPIYDPLRDAPRFRSIIGRVGLN